VPLGVANSSEPKLRKINYLGHQTAKVIKSRWIMSILPRGYRPDDKQAASQGLLTFLIAAPAQATDRLLILLILSVVTWKWLGGRESN
jgi:hypothetical protein